MLVECLRPLEVEAWAVHSGGEALAEAQAAAPDLILLDVMLPDTDGFTVATRLKDDAATRDVPVIIVTTATRVEDRAKSLELGAADCITKPFYYEEVRARVQSALRRAAAARAAKAAEALASTPAAMPAGLQGSLQQLSLPLVVQMLEMEGRSGALHLDGGGQGGVLHLDEGRIVGAEWKGHTGEFAAYRLIRMTDGVFRFAPGDGPAPARDIQFNNQHLLMEAMRRQDEGDRILERLPARDRPLRTTARLAAVLGNRRPAGDLKQLLDLIDGRRTILEILDLVSDDLRILEGLARLEERGLIETT
jgi:CheY-like chemotaxis protein